MELSIDNAYAELDLAPGASEDEVKAAWRRLVSKWHPDRNSHANAGATMQRINQAFERIRLSTFANRGPDPVGDDAAAAPTDAAATAHERRADRADRAHRTVSRKVKLTLEEAASGCAKVLRGQLTDTCSACRGAGFRTLASACPACDGAGAVRQRAWYGWYGTATECEGCGGDGVARQACDTCDSTGKLNTRTYKITVRFPHGVRDGDLLHVDASRLGRADAAVNLDIRVQLSKHPLLALDADGTVRCEVPVDGFAWIANRSIDIPTLAGLQTIALNREQLLYRLVGQGFPIERRGPRGDQLITIVPVFPKRLSTDQQILLDQLIATSSAADGQGADARPAEWNRSLRAWERGLLKRRG